MTWTANEDRVDFAGGDLLELGMAADALRRELHPEGVVTYALTPPVALTLPQAAQEAATYGSGVVLLPDATGWSASGLAEQLQVVRAGIPRITFHHLPANDLLNLEQGAQDLVPRLYAAGLRSLLLEFPPEAQHTDWQQQAAALCRIALAQNLGITAIYTMGRGEDLQTRERDLSSVRALQQDTGAIQSFVLRIQHATTAAARREEEATAVDYLKTLAAARITLDSIPHISAEWSVMGPKVLELALRFGADDAGYVPGSQTGSREPSHHGGEAELRRIIRDAGFRPVERDALFRECLLH